MQIKLRNGDHLVAIAPRKIEMNAVKTILHWVATVGTFLVLGDDALALYKVIEFRAAIPERCEFASILSIYIVVGLSAILMLVALAAGTRESGYARSTVIICCVASATLAAIILLLNGADLTEWPSRALDGRNPSAAWCLLVSLIYVAGSRSRE